jgi:hypothetical protein
LIRPVRVPESNFFAGAPEQSMQKNCKEFGDARTHQGGRCIFHV